MDNVIKQGYLKKAHPTSPSSARTNFATSIRQLLEPSRWYVFGLKRGVPILEYFDKEESVFTSEPINSYDLSTCERITYTLGRTQKNWTFCIFMPGRVLELTAESRERMLSWCQLLERTLHDRGILRKNVSDHVYSEYPIKRPPRKTRAPSPELDLSSQEAANGGSGPTTPVPQENEDQNEDIFETQAGVLYNLREIVAEREASRLSGGDEDTDYNDATWLQDDYTNSTDTVKQKGHGEHDASGSEQDTTGDEDFVTEEFWLSNKITNEAPPVPRRTDSMAPSRFTSSYPGGRARYDDDIGKFPSSAPPLPVRPSSMYIFDSNFTPFEPPPDLPPRPIAAPRRSRLKGTAEVKKMESNGLKDPTTNEQIYDLAKPIPVEPVDSESCDNMATNVPLSETKVKDRRVCVDEQQYDPTYQFNLNRGTTSAEGKNVELLDDGYQAITEVKGSHVSNKANCEDSCKHNGLSAHTDDFCLSVSLLSNVPDLSLDDDEGQTTPTNRLSQNIHERTAVENIYTPFVGSLSADIYDLGPSHVVPPEMPQSAEISLPPRKSVAMQYVSTIPVKPPRKNKTSPKSSPIHSKSNTPTRDLLPEKLPNERSSSPQTTTTHEVGAIPPRKRNVPPLTEYAYVTREQIKNRNSDLPNLPPPRKSNKDSDSFMRKSTGSNVSETYVSTRRNSPTFDGFQFHLGKTSHQADSDNESDDDEESHAYEDATGKHNAPPLPPPRKARSSVTKSNSTVDAHSSRRSQSTENEEAPVLRERAVFRQQSLQERQRISQAKVGLTVIPLKQSQVELLQQEQKFHEVQVRIHSAVGLKIGIVECFGKLWIAGWDMRSNPRLNDKIHIGDQILKVNKVDTSSIVVAQKIFKQHKNNYIELTLKRLPFAQVIAIQRRTQGQSLGIQRDGGTAVITYVDPNGLAAAHGLPPKAKSVESGTDCFWCLTEVNSRPLNLTFKGNEIEHRLNAVGKDISIVVQPDEFVKELRKQLKKLKNYKDYLAF